MIAPPTVQIFIPASLDKVSWLADWLRNITKDILKEEEFVFLEIGTTEIINNIINHAHDKIIDGIINITCSIENGSVFISIIDNGSAIPDDIQLRFDNLDLSSEIDVEATSGRGMRLIKSCFQKVLFSRKNGCNEINAIFPQKNY